MSRSSSPQPRTESRTARLAAGSARARSGRRRSPAELGRIRAAWRFLTDSSAPWLAKVLFVLGVVYLVVPLDAIPDLVPVVGWLDDLGVMSLVSYYLFRSVRRYEEAEAARLSAIDTEGVPQDG